MNNSPSFWTTHVRLIAALAVGLANRADARRAARAAAVHRHPAGKQVGGVR